MSTDLELFMLWNNGRQLEEQIIADIKEHYEIISLCEVSWSKEHFADNLARFYGKNLRKGRKKIKESGIGPFLLIVVADHSPLYYNGKNVKLTNSKYKYRQLFGGGYMVHASDCAKEAFENFLFLTGESLADFAENKKGSKNSFSDPVGVKPWQDEAEIRQILNKIPDCQAEFEKKPICIKTSDPNFTARLLNAKKCWFGKNLYKVSLNGQTHKIKIK